MVFENILMGSDWQEKTRKIKNIIAWSQKESAGPPMTRMWPRRALTVV